MIFIVTALNNKDFRSRRGAAINKNLHGIHFFQRHLLGVFEITANHSKGSGNNQGE
jgi:hypothetical protein